MSDVRLPDLLSNGDNESTKEFIDAFSTNQDAFSKNSFEDNSKVSYLTFSKNPSCTNDGRKPKLDIDIDYAIELLKKEDQNTNV